MALGPGCGIPARRKYSRMAAPAARRAHTLARPENPSLRASSPRASSSSILAATSALNIAVIVLANGVRCEAEMKGFSVWMVFDCFTVNSTGKLHAKILTPRPRSPDVLLYWFVHCREHNPQIWRGGAFLWIRLIEAMEEFDTTKGSKSENLLVAYGPQQPRSMRKTSPSPVLRFVLTKLNGS